MKKYELVFVQSQRNDEEPFTTSEVIAEFAGVQHHAIQQLATKHKERFERFGLLAFEMRAVDKEGNHGIKYEKLYHFNEQQATLLITFLKNTPQVLDFKEELVRQFFQMRRQLRKAADAQKARQPVRRTLTDAIRDYVPESPHKQFAYKHYTDLALKTVTGKNAKQLRVELDAPPKADVAMYLSPEQSAQVARVEGAMGGLLMGGFDYATVKEIIANSPAFGGGNTKPTLKEQEK